jgi:predicted glutamine amidotransferase
MCGLVGMVGFLEHKHKQAMKDLLFLNTLRGKDSTGLSAVRRDRTVCTRKMTVPGYEFIEHPIVEKAFNFGDQLWLGHGRYKTHGDISKANAHPFEVLDDEGDIYLVGAHNGTLENKWAIEGLMGKERFDTDSEALFNWLVKAPNIKEAISHVKGAWSLTWWDPTTDSLHFLRNKERPLSFAFSKDGKVLVWASEPWMLINACRRNGVELEVNERGMSCYSTLEDTLYTLEIPQERDKVLPELKREGGYAGAPARKFHNPLGFGGGAHWWDGDKDDEKGEKKAAAGGQKAQANGKKAPIIVTIGDPPKGDVTRGFGGREISKKTMEAIKSAGCGWCGGSIETGTFSAFLNEDTLVCGRCMRDTHPKETGDCVRRFEDGDYDPDLDDDLPFDLGPVFKETPEYRKLLDQAATRGAENAVG